jgi:hypothetical protein
MILNLPMPMPLLLLLMFYVPRIVGYGCVAVVDVRVRVVVDNADVHVLLLF